jgi:hypothetical protein
MPWSVTFGMGPAVPVLQARVALADVPFQGRRLRWAYITRSILMNTIIYIVGLIVVIGFILSFFGLR